MLKKKKGRTANVAWDGLPSVHSDNTNHPHPEHSPWGRGRGRSSIKAFSAMLRSLPVGGIAPESPEMQTGQELQSAASPPTSCPPVESASASSVPPG